MSSSESSRKRPRWLAPTLAFMLTSQLLPAQGFSTVQTQGSGSALYFRTSADATATAATASISNLFSPTSLSRQLPSWLSSPHNHLAEYNLQQLHVAMRPYFSEAQALKLQYAIQQASNGDRTLLAGTADFLGILVETMELGLHALVAAAYHYCLCVRQRRNESDDWSYPASLHEFGPHVVAIAQDAARLKQLERTAAAVMRQQEDARVDPAFGENFRSLLLSETKDWRGLAIRSAACLYRLRGIRKSHEAVGSEEVRGARDALYIYAPLASRLGMHRLKNELEGTAFEILYPRQYATVTSLARQVRRKPAVMTQHEAVNVDQALHHVLTQVSSQVKDILANDSEFAQQVADFTVTARVKEPYSMWKKMLKHEYAHVLQVPDALALRIILEAKKQTPDEPHAITQARERALCYYAQQLCQESFRPAAKPRHKDYIEMPKANGYQSLHYTARTEWADQDWTFEVQIRSAEMHQVAEFGLASHWDYKLRQSSSASSSQNRMQRDPSADAYLRNVQQWHWQQHGGAAEGTTHATSYDDDIVDRIRAGSQRLEPYITALTHAQSDLNHEFVFVFMTSEGELDRAKVLALPAGACVLDALRASEKSVANYSQFSLNGDAATTLTRQLHNGDVLTVPPAAAVSL